MSMQFRRLGVGLLATGSALALSGCFLTPGDFDSTLDIRADGQFSYSYIGEIHYTSMNDLSEMAEAAEGEDEEDFAPAPCVTEDNKKRRCTDEEIAQQREARNAAGADDAQDMAMAEAMLGGGMDLSDPELAEEFVEALRKQAGWNEVAYLGDGVFEVDFSISSTMTHDFTFPALPDMPTPTTFVSASVLKGGRVRIDAPGFSPEGGADPFQAMMGGMAGMMGEVAQESGDAPAMPNLPQPSGTFRIVTDASILANNTEEGPQDHEDGQMLEWTINARTRSAPTALIQLDF